MSRRIHVALSALLAVTVSFAVAAEKTPPRVRVSEPSVPRPPRKPAQRTARTPAASALNIDLRKDRLTTAAIPSQYRTMSETDLRKELTLLEKMADSTTSMEVRNNVEDLKHLIELRLETGINASDLIEQISNNVARLRDLKLLYPVRFRVIDREELSALLLDKIARELPPGYLEDQEFLLKILGAIPEKADLRKMLLGMLTEQIAGLYDEDTKLLYVMQQFDLTRMLAKVILAHEICHAIQDQHFNIAKLPLNNQDNDDLGLAIACTLEGDATILMQDYMVENYGVKDFDQFLDVFKVDQRAFSKAPYFLRQQLTFPYLSGAKFLMQLEYEDDHLRDDVFTSFPLSTEQILHPEKYTAADRDDPTSFTLPDVTKDLGPGWTKFAQNVFGEFQIKTLFESFREWDAGKIAAEGWDGDRYGFTRKGNDYAFFWMSVWDSNEDADEFMTAIVSLFRERIYKHLSENQPATTATAELMLSHPGDGEHRAVYLRFKKLEDRVLVEAFSHSELAAQADRWDDSLFKAVRATPAAPPVQTPQTTSTTVGITETAREIYETP